MIYEQLFAQVTEPEVVRAGFIGCGAFGTPMITQAQIVPRLDVPVVADVDVEAGKLAFARAGVPADAVAVCESASATLRA